MEKRLYTHCNIDLDAVASLWAVKTFIPCMADAVLVFMPANWDGYEMGLYDFAVDIEAGGKGVKGEKGENGIVHSCFASLIRKYASKKDQEALHSLVTFIDAQDAHGNAVMHLAGATLSEDNKKILGMTGINAVLRALQSTHRGDDALVASRMAEIFNGMLKAGRARQRAKVEAEKAEISQSGKVAIVRNNKEFATNAILFDNGIEFIIYVDGYNIGIIRKNSQTISTSDDAFQAVVAENNELQEWFAHPAGFLFCRGSRKAPATTPSKVNPLKLAKAAEKLLKE